ncbi:glycosyl transferase, partial [Streptomyces sp. JAC128]
MRIDHATPSSPTDAPAAGRQPRVVVAVHEGVYGAASGTGFSNRAFLTALARILPTGRLSVITPHVPETAGTHDRRWTREVQQMLKKAQAQVITIPAVPAPPGSVHGAMQLASEIGVRGATE